MLKIQTSSDITTQPINSKSSAQTTTIKNSSTKQTPHNPKNKFTKTDNISQENQAKEYRI